VCNQKQKDPARYARWGPVKKSHHGTNQARSIGSRARVYVEIFFPPAFFVTPFLFPPHKREYIRVIILIQKQGALKKILSNTECWIRIKKNRPNKKFLFGRNFYIHYLQKFARFIARDDMLKHLADQIFPEW